MCPAQLRDGFYYIALCADYLEMIVQVGEGGLQARTHCEPGFLIHWFRDRSAELKIIGEHGLCSLKITLLDGVHEGLYSFSFIQNVSFITDLTTMEQMGVGINGYSLWNILRYPQLMPVLV